MEGPFAFKRGGKYYLTYPWVRGKAGDLGPDGKPSDNHTECLAYAMSDNPLGPFEYKGIIMQESPTGCWTNHHSIVEYEGQYYLFYHHNDYSVDFDKNRSVRVDSLFFNADGTIREVKPTLRGVGVTKATSQINIDRYTSIAGAAIDFIDPAVPFDGWKTIFTKCSDRVTYNTVDFGEGVKGSDTPRECSQEQRNSHNLCRWRQARKGNSQRRCCLDRTDIQPCYRHERSSQYYSYSRWRHSRSRLISFR